MYVYHYTYIHKLFYRGRGGGERDMIRLVETKFLNGGVRGVAQ